MALFKIAKGPESNLENKEIHEPIAEPNSRFYFYVDISNDERAIAAAAYADRYPVKIVTWS